ncbi:MAG: hypothetical protein R3F07_13305 [Opitutaceae bacterium]
MAPGWQRLRETSRASVVLPDTIEMGRDGSMARPAVTPHRQIGPIRLGVTAGRTVPTVNGGLDNQPLNQVPFQQAAFCLVNQKNT